MKDVIVENNPVITPVPVEYLDTVWPQVEEFMDRAVRTTNDKFTTQSVYDDIKRGFYTLWIIVKDDVIVTALTTRILEYPNKRGLAVDWVGGGNMVEVLALSQSTLRKCAEDNNCDHIEGYGRKAWGRCLKSMAGSQNTLLTKWSYPMGGSTTYNSTTTQAGSSVADLPAWAKPYFERNLAKAEAEYGKGYEAYTGDRLAGQSQDTLDAISGTRDLANREVGITGLSGAQDYMTDGMATAETLGDYNPNTFSEYDYNDAAKFTGANVGQYMNPYTQNVVDRQKAEAMRDFQRTQGARNAQAVQAGAFGGSRGAVRNFLAEDAMMNRMGMIQDKGLRDAYKDATTQFTASRKADMDVDKSRAAELARFEKSTEDADQFAAKQGLNALQTGAGLAKDSVALGELDRQTDIQNLQLLEGIGAAAEGRDQQQLDLDYNEFLAKKGYTAEQIGNMTGILSGMPIAATGTNTYQGTSTTPVREPGTMQQLAGAGLTGLSLYKAYGG